MSALHIYIYIYIALESIFGALESILVVFTMACSSLRHHLYIMIWSSRIDIWLYLQWFGAHCAIISIMIWSSRINNFMRGCRGELIVPSSLYWFGALQPIISCAAAEWTSTNVIIMPTNKWCLKIHQNWWQVSSRLSFVSCAAADVHRKLGRGSPTPARNNIYISINI